MNVRRFAAFFAAFVLVAGAPGTAVAEPETRTETRPYIGLVGDLIATCQFDPDFEEGLGGACFDVFYEEEPTVALEIDDFTGLPVGAYYRFEPGTPDDDGELEYEGGLFCGSVEGIEVPEDAYLLRVYVDGPVFGPLDCDPLAGAPGIGTFGDIIATFTGH